MNKFQLFAAFTVFLFACATKSPAPVSGEPHELHYEFSWSKCGAKPCLHQKLSFLSSEHEEQIKLPKEVIGMKDLYRVIQNLRLTSKSGKLSKTEDEAVYTVKSKPGSEIVIECDVIQDFEGDTSLNERYYRPLVSDQQFQVFGEALFLYPSWEKNKTRRISLRFDLPSNFTIANSFGAKQDHQQIETSIERLRQGTYLGGAEVRLKNFSIEGKPVWLASMGKLSYSDDKTVEVLKRILETERGFWNDYNFPYYFVSAISVSKDLSGGGQGRTNGFAIFGSESFQSGWMEHLLAHELFHTWNGHTILKQEREERIYWFSEGFTDFYANTLAYRAGLIKFADAVKEINLVIKHYYFSSKRSATLDQVETDFWINREVQKLPYQQGFLLAQAWNDEIKRKSKGKKSLDDVMRAMLFESKIHQTLASNESVEKTVQPFLKRDPTADIDQWIVTGGTIPVLPTKLAQCARLQETEVEKFDLGFDYDLTKVTKVFTGVNQAGPAYRAGLRDGDLKRELNVYFSNPKKEVSLIAMHDGSPVKIHYLPAGDPVKIPQYVLKRGCSPKSL
jgi:predicted metalloprotease with PDZ domain